MVEKEVKDEMNEKYISASFENIVSELTHALSDKDVRDIVLITDTALVNIGDNVKDSVHIANGNVVIGDPEKGLSVLLDIKSINTIRIEKISRDGMVDYIKVKFTEVVEDGRR
ncbi:MAG: hypothetical protein QW292_02905 [Candidatus Parvarchaeota archaeon]